MGTKKPTTTLYDRILGALVGFAIGDAMGATTEFMSQKEIERKYGQVSSLIGGGWLHLKPGEVTDDTQMMLCVAKAYTQKEQIPFEEGCCKTFVEWYKTNPKDVGGACARAIVRNEGQPAEDWMKTSIGYQQLAHQEDLGNGSLMRALFPCLVGDIPAAIRQGRLTHNNKTCSASINLYGTTISDLLSGDFEVNTQADIMKEPMKPTGHVSNTIHNALFWLCNAPSFSSAVIGAVNHGGDADTIAAITGSLAGARWGYKAIPTEWVDTLDRDIYHAVLSCAEMATDLVTEGCIR